MRYISLDLETTCVTPSLRDPEKIIGMSMVVEDSTQSHIPVNYLPHCTFLIDQEVFTGEPYALQMNHKFLKQIADSKNKNKNGSLSYIVYNKNEWLQVAKQFVIEHFPDCNSSDPYVKFKARPPVAGKNVSNFDLHFLPTELKELFDHRVIDAGNLFIDWSTNHLPGLSQVKKQAGMSNTKVSHDMYHDALDVISCLRTTYPTN